MLDETIQTEMQGYFELWEKNRYPNQLSKTALPNYQKSIRRFLKWCYENKIHPCEVGYPAIEAYFEHCRQTAGSNSIRTYRSQLENFYDFLVYNLELIARNPFTRHKKASKIRKIPIANHPKAPLEDVRTLVYNARQIVVRTATAILLETGMRPKELIAVEVDHINLSDTPKHLTIQRNSRSVTVTIHPWTIWVRYGKGALGENPRHVILVGPVRQILQRFLNWRETQDPATPTLLFNRNGRPFPMSGLMRQFYNACEQLGIKSGAGKGYVQNTKYPTRKVGVNAIYPRQIRPTFRTETEKRGMKKKVMDLQMGHQTGDVGNTIYNQRTYEERLDEHIRIGPLLVA